jgi:hypothetical protein
MIDYKSIKRFWSKVNKLNDCWEWTGSLNEWGYGRFYFAAKEWRAHRFSWLLHFGPIPIDQLVLHTCDNPKCINPNHLFLGSHIDNMRDKIRKKRYKSQTGDKNFAAKLSEQDVLNIRYQYISSKISQYKLAEHYGVTRSTISAILTRRSWQHI